MLETSLQPYILLDNIISSKGLQNLVPQSHCRGEGERREMGGYITFQRHIGIWGLSGCLQNKFIANTSFRLIFISKLPINNTENTVSNSLWIPGVWKPKKTFFLMTRCYKYGYLWGKEQKPNWSAVRLNHAVWRNLTPWLSERSILGTDVMWRPPTPLSVFSAILPTSPSHAKSNNLIVSWQISSLKNEGQMVFVFKTTPIKPDKSPSEEFQIWERSTGLRVFCEHQFP